MYKWTYRLFLFLLGLLIDSTPGVSGMQVYTSGQVDAVNGTDIRLKCTFRSSHPIKIATLTISWSFRPTGVGNEETVFYYHETPFPPEEGRFFKKVGFAGDISSSDASIIVRRVKFSFNGNFSCQVKNPPDVHGNVGEIQLRVVTSAPLSEIVILAVAIGGAVVLAVAALAIAGVIRGQRKAERSEIESFRQERKDLVVW